MLQVVIGRLCASDLKFVEVEKVGVRSWQPFYDDVLVLKVLLHLSCVCVCALGAHMSQSRAAAGRRVCKVLFLLAAAAMARAVYHTCSTLYGLKVKLQRDQQNLISGSRPRFKPKSSAIYHSLLLPPAALPVHTLSRRTPRYYALLHAAATP